MTRGEGLQRYTIRAAIICLAVLSSVAGAKGQTCEEFHGTTPQAALAYLKQDRTTLEPWCINMAVAIFGGHPYAPAKKTLLEYIDFKRPFPIGKPGPTGGQYPAADVLSDYGQSVVPDLKAILTSDDKNVQSRLNAVSVWFWISPKPLTVAFVAQAAKDAGDRDAGEKLANLAALLPKYCHKEDQPECEKALSDPAAYLNK
jgi:hypothetical protein